MGLEKHYEHSNRKDCGGKKSFPSYREAAEFNNRMKRRGSVFVAKGKKIERMHPYKCKNCEHYHIGHEARSRGRHRPEQRLRPQ